MKWLPLLIFCLTTSLFAQVTSEPGYQQSKEPGQAPQMPKQWSHPPIEARGVWIPRDSMEARPGETKEQLRQRLSATMGKLKAAHFNIILVDCWFKGFVSYPNSEFAPQYPPFIDNDIPAFLIDEAHKRN